MVVRVVVFSKVRVSMEEVKHVSEELYLWALVYIERAKHCLSIPWSIFYKGTEVKRNWGIAYIENTQDGMTWCLYIRKVSNSLGCSVSGVGVPQRRHSEQAEM